MAETPSGTRSTPEAKKKGIPVWVVVVGALAACLGILVILAVVVGAYAISHSKGLKKDAQIVKERGAAFGRSHEQRDCVKDVLGRLDTSDFLQQVGEHLYLDACLEVARPTDGFCQDVPPESKILSSVLWRQEACSRHGKPGNEDCARMMGKVQGFCHPRDPRPESDSSAASR